MYSILICNQEREERRVLSALWKVDWKLPNYSKITLRKSQSSSDEPLYQERTPTAWGMFVLPRHRHPWVDSPTHMWAGWCSSASWAGLPGPKQVLNARVTPWYLRCDPGQPGPKRGVRACTWRQWGIAAVMSNLKELIHMSVICSTKDSQWFFPKISKSLTLCGKTISHWLRGALQHANSSWESRCWPWQMCMRPAHTETTMTCSHPSPPGYSTHRVLLCPWWGISCLPLFLLRWAGWERIHNTK